MIGTIVGDIAGAIYEFRRKTIQDFEIRFDKMEARSRMA